jgi:hypothetical protein
VLHEIVERTANARADGEVLEQARNHEKRSVQPRFSVTDFISERGKDIITATIGFT